MNEFRNVDYCTGKGERNKKEIDCQLYSLDESFVCLCNNILQERDEQISDFEKINRWFVRVLLPAKLDVRVRMNRLMLL
jgi:hypothetical protein